MDGDPRLTQQIAQDLKKKAERPLYHQTLTTLGDKRLVEQVKFAAASTKDLIKRKMSENN